MAAGFLLRSRLANIWAGSQLPPSLRKGSTEPGLAIARFSGAASMTSQTSTPSLKRAAARRPARPPDAHLQNEIDPPPLIGTVPNAKVGKAEAPPRPPLVVPAEVLR